MEITPGIYPQKRPNSEVAGGAAKVTRLTHPSVNSKANLVTRVVSKLDIRFKACKLLHAALLVPTKQKALDQRPCVNIETISGEILGKFPYDQQTTVKSLLENAAPFLLGLEGTEYKDTQLRLITKTKNVLISPEQRISEIIEYDEEGNLIPLRKIGIEFDKEYLKSRSLIQALDQPTTDAQLTRIIEIANTLNIHTRDLHLKIIEKLKTEEQFLNYLNLAKKNFESLYTIGIALEKFIKIKGLQAAYSFSFKIEDTLTKDVYLSFLARKMFLEKFEEAVSIAKSISSTKIKAENLFAFARQLYRSARKQEALALAKDIETNILTEDVMDKTKEIHAMLKESNFSFISDCLLESGKFTEALEIILGQKTDQRKFTFLSCFIRKLQTTEQLLTVLNIVKKYNKSKALVIQRNPYLECSVRYYELGDFQNAFLILEGLEGNDKDKIQVIMGMLKSLAGPDHLLRIINVAQKFKLFSSKKIVFKAILQKITTLQELKAATTLLEGNEKLYAIKQMSNLINTPDIQKNTQLISAFFFLVIKKAVALELFNQAAQVFSLALKKNDARIFFKAIDPLIENRNDARTTVSLTIFVDTKEEKLALGLLESITDTEKREFLCRNIFSRQDRSFGISKMGLEFIDWTKDQVLKQMIAKIILENELKFGSIENALSIIQKLNPLEVKFRGFALLVKMITNEEDLLKALTFAKQTFPLHNANITLLSIDKYIKLGMHQSAINIFNQIDNILLALGFIKKINNSFFKFTALESLLPKIQQESNLEKALETADAIEDTLQKSQIHLSIVKRYIDLGKQMQASKIAQEIQDIETKKQAIAAIDEAFLF
jgi:hypothetical protein